MPVPLLHPQIQPGPQAVPGLPRLPKMLLLQLLQLLLLLLLMMLLLLMLLMLLLLRAELLPFETRALTERYRPGSVARVRGRSHSCPRDHTCLF